MPTIWFQFSNGVWWPSVCVNERFLNKELPWCCWRVILRSSFWEAECTPSVPPSPFLTQAQTACAPVIHELPLIFLSPASPRKAVWPPRVPPGKVVFGWLFKTNEQKCQVHRPAQKCRRLEYDLRINLWLCFAWGVCGLNGNIFWPAWPPVLNTYAACYSNFSWLELPSEYESFLFFF